MAKLTKREDEIVIALMRHGWFQPPVAEELCISKKTLVTHMAHIYTKFRIGGRPGAMARLAFIVGRSQA